MAYRSIPGCRRHSMGHFYTHGATGDHERSRNERLAWLQLQRTLRFAMAKIMAEQWRVPPCSRHRIKASVVRSSYNIRHLRCTDIPRAQETSSIRWNCTSIAQKYQLQLRSKQIVFSVDTAICRKLSALADAYILHCLFLLFFFMFAFMWSIADFVVNSESDKN